MSKLDEILEDIDAMLNGDIDTDDYKVGLFRYADLKSWALEQRIDDLLWLQDRLVAEDSVDDIKESVNDRLAELRKQIRGEDE